MTDTRCKLLVIGAGPGGYVCAVRAGQLGIDTVIVDSQPPGGTCLNVGCIPSKALIHAADEYHKLRDYAEQSTLGISTGSPSIDLAQTVAWKNDIVTRLNQGVTGLFSQAGVRFVKGTAQFVDGKTVDVDTADGAMRIQADVVVIATGSHAASLPNIPFGGNVVSSTQALSLRTVPDHLTVIGGGYIGLELGMAYAKLGAQVTIVDAADRLLPQYDAELTRPVVKRVRALGITVHTQAVVKRLTEDGQGIVITDSEQSEQSLSADVILVAIGRVPLTEQAGTTSLQLTMNQKFIKIDDQCRTSMRDVFAIGDVTGEPMLAHRAMAQGELVAEIINGSQRVWDKQCIPAVCFTDPEIVTVGLSPQEAKDQSVTVESTVYPFKANGRALTMGRDDGFVRVVWYPDTGVIAGIQAVGCGIAELSASFALALEMGARLEDIALTVHAHPTLSEAFQEAALRGAARQQT